MATQQKWDGSAWAQQALNTAELAAIQAIQAASVTAMNAIESQRTTDLATVKASNDPVIQAIVRLMGW